MIGLVVATADNLFMQNSTLMDGYLLKVLFCLGEKMNIERYIDNELNNPGNIDCFGVTYTGREEKEAKCYRFLELSEKRSKLLELGQANSSKNEIRKSFKVQVSEKIEALEVIDSFWKKEQIDLKQNNITELIEILEDSFDDGKIHLTQLCVKQMAERFKEIKFYSTLRRFNGKEDFRGICQTYAENKTVFERMYSHLNIKDNASNILINIAFLLQSIQYYPSLLGFNFGKDYYEMKVYFEFFEDGEYNFEHIFMNNISNIKQVCKILNIADTEVLRYIQYFYDKRYFLRGIALSFVDGNVVDSLKMYFFEMKRFI